MSRRAALVRTGWLSAGALLGGLGALRASRYASPADHHRPTGPHTPRHHGRFAYRSRHSPDWSPSCVGDLYLPQEVSGPVPVVMFVHGGGWADAAVPRPQRAVIARDLASYGMAVWNVEYRGFQSVPDYHGVLQDVADAEDYLQVLRHREQLPLDLDRLYLAGHSAGGELAGWALCRHRFRTGQLGAHPPLRPKGGVLLSAPLDLARAYRWGDKNVKHWLKESPEREPRRYRETSPMEYLPLGLPITCVVGRQDGVVAPVQSEAFVERARDRGDTEDQLVKVLGGHGAPVDYGTLQWAIVRKVFLDMVL